jgi:vacuolar-type H+-ATPase subunit F/Vma7
MAQDLYVIGDADTAVGFAYAGVRGTSVETAEEALKAFESVLHEGRVKILVITEGAAGLIRDRVDQVRFHRAEPVIVEIPGAEGPRPDRRGLMELIRQAIGIGI